LPHLPPPVLGLFANSNEEVTRMLSKSAGIAVLTLSAGLLLATAAQAKTIKCTATNRGTAVSIGGSFSFDGSTTSIAALNTFAGSIECKHKHSFSGDFHGQGVNEYSTDTTPCTFTGIFGESENGFDTKLVGIVYAIDQENGSTFWTGKSESGCFNPSTGAFSATETDELVAGTGVFAGVTGTTTYTVTGFVLGPPPATGALGFFEWFQIKGTNTLTLP
jgi:hypothetical protein